MSPYHCSGEHWTSVLSDLKKADISRGSGVDEACTFLVKGKGFRRQPHPSFQNVVRLTPRTTLALRSTWVSITAMQIAMVFSFSL